MATKKIKIKKTVLKDENKLETKSVICAICRTIFVEPVTLPCNHTFCKECFETSMKNTILSCPSCRLRVSSWFRRSEKANSIVNEEFWKYIQHQYSRELRNKQNKVTNSIGECSKPMNNPAEFRMYEKEKRKTLEEHRKVQEAEEGASFSLFKNSSMAKKEANKHFNAGKILKNPRLTKTSLTQDYNNLPSTSKNIKKSSIYSKFGTMDRFIQVDSVDCADHSHKQTYVKKFNKKKLNSDLNNKKYLCHDMSVEKNPPQIPTVNLLNNFERDHRKACTSGYKSTGSGDVIDQEINHYFKPISVPKGCQFTLTPPLKVVPLVGIIRESVSMQSPSGPFSLNANNDASAFIKLYSQIGELTTENVKVSDKTENEKSFKRKLSSTNSDIVQKKLRIEDADLIALNNIEPEFCGFHNSQQASVENIKDLYKNCVKTLEHSVISKEPKFCGFHNSQRKSVEDARSTLKKCITNLEKNLEIQCNNATIFCDINKVDVNRNIPVDVDIKAIAEEWKDEKSMDKTPLENVEYSRLDEQIGNNTIIKEISQLSQTPTTSNIISLESSVKLCNNNLLFPKKLSGKFEDEKIKKSKEKSPKISNTTDDVHINVITPIIKRITRSNAQKLLEANKSNRLQDIASLKIIHQSREETLVESEDKGDLVKKKSQEKEDFEYAKKLQAHFDRIQRVSRTRRTNKRQISLDKILIT